MNKTLAPTADNGNGTARETLLQQLAEDQAERQRACVADLEAVLEKHKCRLSAVVVIRDGTIEASRVEVIPV